MRRETTRLSAATALAATFSMIATPAAAIELPGPSIASVSLYDGEEEAAHRDRHRHRHDRGGGIGVGDVIAGAVVLGSIAAIAGVFDKSDDRRVEERYPARYPEDARYNEPGDGASYRSSGMDNAVDMCVDAVEDERATVGSVDSASRASEGWFVSGATRDGAPWSCRIGPDGRDIDVEVGDNYSAYGEPEDGYYSTRQPAQGDRYSVGQPVRDVQYSDDFYSRARAEQRRQSDDRGIDGDLGG